MKRFTAASAVYLLAFGLCGCQLVADRADHRAAVDAAGSFRDCEICPQMVPIPEGRFTMGSPASEDRWEGGREDPLHPVRIGRRFALGKYEVTRAQFEAFVQDTGDASHGCALWSGESWAVDPSKNWRDPGFAQGDDHPVVCVSWADAQAYASWLALKTGRRYRLPSEAEWEYAARAGTTSARYWGELASEGCVFANQGDRSLFAALGLHGFADCEDGFAYTAPVGSYRANGWGLHDMLGNAWEWTQDCWHVGYLEAPDDGSARIDGDCALRVPRGGSWNSHQRNVRSANRGSYRSGIGFFHIGFRVARDD